jgi:hypothetical protein
MIIHVCVGVHTFMYLYIYGFIYTYTGFFDNLQPLSFVSCEGTISSDHKPVVRTFYVLT